MTTTIEVLLPVLLLACTAAAQITVLPTEEGHGAAVATADRAGSWMVFRANDPLPVSPAATLEGGKVAVIVGKPGVYSVVLLYLDDSGSIKWEAAAVTIGGTDPGPPVVADANGPYTGVVGKPVQFNASASTGPIASWKWTFGDGGTGSGPTPTHAYQSAGTFAVELVVTGSRGQTSTASSAVKVTAGPQPGKRIVVIVYDVDVGLPLPPNDSGLQGVQPYVNAKHGPNAYRLLPDDSTADWAQRCLTAMKQAGIGPPSLVIDDGTTVTASRLPGTGAETVAKIKEAGG